MGNDGKVRRFSSSADLETLRLFCFEGRMPENFGGVYFGLSEIPGHRWPRHLSDFRSTSEGWSNSRQGRGSSPWPCCFWPGFSNRLKKHLQFPASLSLSSHNRRAESASRASAVGVATLHLLK